MGFTNGTLSYKSEKGGKVQKGIGFKSTPGIKTTPDNHFHLQNKRITNLSAPMDDHDATTKRFVPDLLKAKAGTTYVNNELAKKANSSDLKDYALITDLGT